MATNRIKIIINHDVDINFPFTKYISHMVNLVPKNDIVGLYKINIQYNIPKNTYKKIKGEATQAIYYRDKAFGGGIDVFLSNIINISIPDYAFTIYKEIGGLFFSEIIFHEIGHHVHFSKRHGIRKKNYEKYASKYARIGYLKYFKSRSSKILMSYKLASLNIFYFSKTDREVIVNSRKELENYKKYHKEISFP